MVHQGLLHLPLPARVSGTKKVKEVRVLEYLGCHVRVRGWERGREVGDGLTLAFVETAFDLQHQHVPAPALLTDLPGVPQTNSGIVKLIQKCDVVVPGNLCKHLLHNLVFGPGSGKGAHVFEVARRKALYIGELAAQVRREPVDDFGAPAFALLALENDATDIPAQKHHGGVCGKYNAQALFANALLKFVQQARIIEGEPFGAPCCRKSSSSLLLKRLGLALFGFICHIPAPPEFQQWLHRVGPPLPVRALSFRFAMFHLAGLCPQKRTGIT